MAFNHVQASCHIIIPLLGFFVVVLAFNLSLFIQFYSSLAPHLEPHHLSALAFIQYSAFHQDFPLLKLLYNLYILHR